MPQPSTSMSLDQIEQEVKRGLPCEAARWREMHRQLRYYRRKGHEMIKPREAEQPADFAARPKLNSRLTSRVIRELAKGPYSPGPTRRLAGTGSAGYDAAVASNGLNSLMQQAERMAHLHGVFAIQAGPAAGRRAPVSLYPWRADEFAVWLSDDDPTEPWAVCVRSCFPARQQVRYQLWSDAEVRTYWTRVGDLDAIGSGDRICVRDDTASMPHGLGCLPFVFVHSEPPVDEFWTEGIGGDLADADEVLCETLSDLAQAIQVHCIPREYADNVSIASRLYAQASSMVSLTRQDREKEARVFFNQPELRVDEIWTHIRNYADGIFQDLDLPFRAEIDQHAPESGIALVIRRMPLIDAWRGRQPLCTGVEESLARVIGSITKQPGKLSATWPEPALPLPSAERDEADRRALDLGMTSRIRMVMVRHGLTRDQAIAYLEGIKQDLEEEKRIFPEPAPVPDDSGMAA